MYSSLLQYLKDLPSENSLMYISVNLPYLLHQAITNLILISMLVLTVLYFILMKFSVIGILLISHFSVKLIFHDMAASGYQQMDLFHLDFSKVMFSYSEMPYREHQLYNCPKVIYIGYDPLAIFSLLCQNFITFHINQKRYLH